LKPRPDTPVQSPVTLAHVRIREATSSDKGPILEFCKNTWPGGDYISYVWDDWLKDPKGQLVVATLDGKPVGCAHAYFQARQVAWLEGVRVSAAYRGIGIAGKLNKALTNYAARKGARVARLCTGILNIPSRKHLARTGFKVCQTFQRLDSEKELHRRPLRVVRPVKKRKGLWKWLQGTSEFRESGEAYSDGWTWYPLTPASFRRLLKERRVLLTSSNDTHSSLSIISSDDRKLTLGFAAGETEGIAKQAKFLRFLLSKRKHDRVRCIVPTKSNHHRTLEEAGFQRSGKILLYERRLG